MNRRIFVGGGLAAMAPAAEKVKIAFLGGSHSHARAKVELVKRSPDWELAGIAEPNPKVRAEYEKAGVPILDRARLLGDASIRVIAVESDVKSHGADGRAALEAGKHVHLEKPPTTILREFDVLLSLAAEHKTVLQMGYMWRHHPGINRALEAARNGWLGDIFMVRGTIGTYVAPERRPEWAVVPGGHMFELGCHLIDPLVRLLGAPQRMSSSLHRHGSPDDGLMDNNLVVFEYPRALGMVMGSALQPGAGAHRAFEVFGTKGTAVVRPIEPAALEMDLAEAAGPYPKGSTKVALPPYQRYVADFEELHAAVTGQRPLSVTPKEDRTVHSALLAASRMV